MDNLEVKIYPLILHHRPSASLWHLGRMLDSNGSGKFSISILDAHRLLGISRATFYRYIKDNSFFHKVVRHNLIYTLYYKSLKSIRTSLSLPDVITSAFGTNRSISPSSRKQSIVSILIESLQSNAFYKCRREKHKHQKINPPLTYFSESNSISDKTQGIKRNSFGVFINSDSFACYGASQSTIASILSRSTRTINYHIRNFYSNLDNFPNHVSPKLRQFFSKPEFLAQYSKAKFFDDEDGSHDSNLFFFDHSSGLVYKRFTSLYCPVWTLKRKTFVKPPSRKARF